MLVRTGLEHRSNLGDAGAMQRVVRLLSLRRGLRLDERLEDRPLTAIAGHRSVRQILGENVLFLQRRAHPGGGAVIALKHIPLAA